MPSKIKIVFLKILTAWWILFKEINIKINAIIINTIKIAFFLQ